MYNSHGVPSTLSEIVRIEKDERDNLTFDTVSENILEKYKNYNAIWLAPLMMAFRYSINSSDWEMTDKQLQEKYPDYEKQVVEYKTKDLIPIAVDCDDGILFVIDKGGN